MSLGRPTTAPTEQSLVEILQSRAQTAPERQIFCYLDDGETESAHLTYGQLDQRARVIAAALQQLANIGDRVLLVYPPGLEFIAALFGCFYAGMIAVPVYPPRMGLAPDPLRPLLNIAANCQPRVMLVGDPFVETMRAATAIELAAVGLIVTESIATDRHERFVPVALTRETTALLQYTSGSTGDPKGVMISQGNILANEYALQLAFQHRTAEEMGNGVCWLPLYHDMGLIGNVLQAVYVDGPCWLMSPLALLQHPIRWLQAISKYRAYSSGGPNFAYDLCVRRITEEQKQSLDLSGWEIAAIGAEPISPEVMDCFANAFASCGFRREAFYPCYGLAEATLMVTGGEKDSLPVVRSFASHQLQYREAGEPVDESPNADFIQLVGCGHARKNHDVIIVDPVTRQACPTGNVGEIWFRGPSVAQGYWQRPEETAETFQAVLRDQGNDAKTYLRTGDLGFLDDGELFVCGRLKDLIVIRGHNHYPHDLEETVARLHEAFPANSTAAIGCVINGVEQLVLLQEIDRQSRRLKIDELRAKVKAVIAERHQLQVFETVFLQRGALPKTTSGKIRRFEARQRYLSGQLPLWTGSPAA